jgi:hypothetical protein
MQSIFRRKVDQCMRLVGYYEQKDQSVPRVSIILNLLFSHLVHSVDLKIREIFKQDAIINKISLVTTPVFDYCGG